jgi:hypothetical protein
MTLGIILLVWLVCGAIWVIGLHNDKRFDDFAENQPISRKALYGIILAMGPIMFICLWIFKMEGKK